MLAASEAPYIDDVQHSANIAHDSAARAVDLRVLEKKRRCWLAHMEGPSCCPHRFQEGVALGDLLHSVALAPGESTRVAITSGSRTSSTTTTQDILQTDSLDTTSDSSRAIQV